MNITKRLPVAALTIALLLVSAPSAAAWGTRDAPLQSKEQIQAAYDRLVLECASLERDADSEQASNYQSRYGGGLNSYGSYSYSAKQAWEACQNKMRNFVWNPEARTKCWIGNPDACYRRTTF